MCSLKEINDMIIQTFKKFLKQTHYDHVIYTKTYKQDFYS